MAYRPPALRPAASEAMYQAVLNKNPKAVRLLLKSPDCDVNYCGADKWTALLRACASGCLDIVQNLLEHKVDVNKTTQDGKSPLLWASSRGYIQIVEMLAKHPGIKINLAAWNGWSALMFASYGNHFEVVKTLLKNSCDVNQVSDGITALSLACSYGSFQSVEVLLAHEECDVSICDPRGYNPLMFAFERPHSNKEELIRIVKLLLENGINIDHTDKEGATALMHLCKSSTASKEIVQLLLDNHADAHIERKLSPCSSLEFAAVSGNIDVCTLLLQHGCDPKNNKEAAIKLATAKKHFSILSLFRSPTTQYGTPVKSASFIGGVH